VVYRQNTLKSPPRFNLQKHDGCVEGYGLPNDNNMMTVICQCELAVLDTVAPLGSSSLFTLSSNYTPESVSSRATSEKFVVTSLVSLAYSLVDGAMGSKATG
jgi:hypothetical protein